MNPSEITAQLAQLARDLDANVSALEAADREAVLLRHEADLAQSKAEMALAGVS